MTALPFALLAVFWTAMALFQWKQGVDDWMPDAVLAAAAGVFAVFLVTLA